MQKITVFEVAASAGVSLATVDRVLNGRKGVRPETIVRVRAAVDRLGFRRDAFAAGLATQRLERYLFLLPARGTNSFINTLHDTVARAASVMADQRVSLRVMDYVAFDDASLASLLGTVDPEAFDGVAVVAVDAPAVRHEIDRLVEREIPIVTLVSDVSPSRRSLFLGIDNRAAGRVAASLIGRMAQARQAGSGRGGVGIIVGQMTLNDHADRRLGFEQVMRREFPGLSLLPVVEGLDDSAVSGPLAARMFAEHPDMVGLYSAGAGNRGIIAALRANAAAQGTPHVDGPIVVAHELTAHARDALLSGTFTAVLHQDQEQEVENAIAALRSVTRATPGFNPKPVRMQIFLRDNVP
ncbi:LacI family DNA-binding transcriptional regulator [Lichenicola sp.]|uniref:LacI family DNA-binding transcriptional regulator n=1 Tax=Lichenicola sp. TaxID=2804529 RepID=UPI003AFFC35B